MNRVNTQQQSVSGLAATSTPKKRLSGSRLITCDVQYYLPRISHHRADPRLSSPHCAYHHHGDAWASLTRFVPGALPQWTACAPLDGTLPAARHNWNCLDGLTPHLSFQFE